MNNITPLQSVKNLRKAKKMIEDLKMIEKNMDVCIKTLDKYWAYITVAEVVTLLKNNIQLVRIQQKTCQNIIDSKGIKHR